MTDSKTISKTMIRQRLIAVAAAAAALMMVTAATAEAKSLGTTTLKPNAPTFKTLAGLGISVTPTKPAKAANGGIAFPITGANLSPNLTGSIKHKGGLKFKSSHAKLKVKNFIVRITNKKAKLVAFAGKQKVRLLTLDLRKAKLTNGGKTVKRVKAKLAGPGAEALSATFGAHIAKGTPIGRVQVAFK